MRKSVIFLKQIVKEEYYNGENEEKSLSQQKIIFVICLEYRI